MIVQSVCEHLAKTAYPGKISFLRYWAVSKLFLSPNSIFEWSWAKSWVFGHFLEYILLILHIMIDRQWYLACIGGSVAEKNIFRPKFRPNLVQNGVFGKYFDSDSFDLSDIAHSDWFQWYLTINGGFLYCPQNFGQNLGPYRPKIGPKSGFWQIFRKN